MYFNKPRRQVFIVISLCLSYSFSVHAGIERKNAVKRHGPPKVPSLATKPKRSKEVSKTRTPPPLQAGETQAMRAQRGAKDQEKIRAEQEKVKKMFPGMAPKIEAARSPEKPKTSMVLKKSIEETGTNGVKNAYYLKRPSVSGIENTKLALPSGYDQMSVQDKKNYHMNEVKEQNKILGDTMINGNNKGDVQERNNLVAAHLSAVQGLDSSASANKKNSPLKFKVPKFFQKSKSDPELTKDTAIPVN